MNFISHYYLERDEVHPCYVLGLALPDLLRNFNNNTRLREHHTRYRFEDENLMQMNEGVKKHLEADRLFHNSEFFKNNTAFILKLLKEKPLETVRRHHYVLAHVLLEMMLDRLLIKGHPGICSKFYTDIGKTEDRYIEMYLKKLNFVNNLFDYFLFFVFFSRFKHAQYLREYVHNESLIYALNRVFSRISKQKFSNPDKKHLEHCIIETENYLSKHYLEIFNEILCQV